MTLRRVENTGPGPMSAAVSASLAALDLPPTDAALAQLCRQHAAEIDATAERMARFDRLIERLSRSDDAESYDALQVARGMLGARATLDRLGARLQTALDALRATPRARPMPPPRVPDTSSLGRLRLAAGSAVAAAPDGPADGGNHDGGPVA